jgi:hypothetical protein
MLEKKPAAVDPLCAAAQPAFSLAAIPALWLGPHLRRQPRTSPPFHHNRREHRFELRGCQVLEQPVIRTSPWTVRMGDRAVECARLESVCTERYRGFESRPIRHGPASFFLFFYFLTAACGACFQHPPRRNCFQPHCSHCRSAQASHRAQANMARRYHQSETAQTIGCGRSGPESG